MNQEDEVVRLLRALAHLCAPALLGAMLLAAPARADITGQVLDEASDQPIAGAVVVVEWRALQTTLVEAHDECLHVDSTVTDAQGRYRFAFWAGAWSPHNLIYFDRYHTYFAYKFNYVPGFRPGDPEGVVRLKPFTGTADEWFEPKYFDLPVGSVNWFAFRMQYSGACFDRMSQHNLYRLYDTFAKDAATIATTPQQKAYVDAVNKHARGLLVNYSKPTHPDKRGEWVNQNPADAYTPEMLLK